LRSSRVCVKLLFVRTVLTTNPLEAAEFVKAGGVVAFPTETVYGLGANVFDADAVQKVFDAKRRPADNPLIAHVASAAQIEELTTVITDNARTLIDAFFPGPLTVVLPRSPDVPLIATAGLDTIGVRMPSNELAQAFIAACFTPLVAPSANLSGRPSPTTWEAVLEDLDGKIDCILQGEPTEIGLESTVVDCSDGAPLLLRPGAVSLGDLRAVMPETRAAGSDDEAVKKSPGTRHPHYSPRARVMVFDLASHISDSTSAAYIGVTRPPIEFAYTHVCEDVREYAHSLFEFFRECDRRGIEAIYCEPVENSGIGAALMDRIRRAAGDEAISM
jgi:L-threonylcarbamoyladenylate synthase